VNIFGPTWLDLNFLVDVGLETLAISISIRAGSFSCGAIIGKRNEK